MRLDTIEKRLEYRAAVAPKGSIKVRPKGLDLEFQLYTTVEGVPCARCYRGTAAKPIWRYRFKDEAQREKHIAEQIKAEQDRAAFRAANAGDRMAPHKLEVGHILVTCWGYEQTNREFYRVAKVPGPRVAIVERVESVSAGETGWMQGKVVPGEKVIGKPLKLVAHYGRVSPEGHYASLWDGRPVNWTGYA